MPATDEVTSGVSQDAAQGGEFTTFEALRNRSPTNRHTFVAVVEIDRFAVLRQKLGYQLANAVMAELARRLTSIAHIELGRIGRTAIEFAFSAGASENADKILHSAVKTLERRMVIDGFTLDLSVTIGCADAGRGAICDELVDQAAAALTDGRAQHLKVCFATERALTGNGLADFDLMRLLPSALETGEVSLHYQPKLDARDNAIRGAEALFRWFHPLRGLIQTDKLIALAEETGAIRDITEWVIARAVADQKRIAADGFDLEICINISGQLLSNKAFFERALALTAHAAGRIGFEITETAVIGDPEAALAHLRAFAEAGIKIAIDDYGSGLSSLAYLKELPAHELKIDRMFVSGLTDSHRDPLLVRSSIDLAHALEMEVTAEGVDDAMSLSLLRIMGCDLLQGYFISPPLPLDQLLTFLNDQEILDRLALPPAARNGWARPQTA